MDHWSSCAVNNGPALPVGPCNCGNDAPEEVVQATTEIAETPIDHQRAEINWMGGLLIFNLCFAILFAAGIIIGQVWPI